MPQCAACGTELEPPVRASQSTSRRCTASPAKTADATTSSGLPRKRQRHHRGQTRLRTGDGRPAGHVCRGTLRNGLRWPTR